MSKKGEPTTNPGELERRRKISESLKGNKRSLGKNHTEESKQKISIGNKGRIKSEEECLKISKSKKEACNTLEFKQKMSRIIKLKYKDIDYRERVSKGIKLAYDTNPEYKEKIRIYRKNLWDTEWYKEKMKGAFESLIGGFWYGNVKYYDTPQYCEKFNREFKERVRAYWGYKCVECGGVSTGGVALSVHHVHYDKKMCCNGSPHDIVPLCRSCHSKTNSNLDYWEEHFTEMIYSLDPNGKCFFTKEEMKKN